MYSPNKHNYVDQIYLISELLQTYALVSRARRMVENGQYANLPSDRLNLQRAKVKMTMIICSPVFDGCEYGPESVGVDRAFGAAGDAAACIRDALDTQHYMNSIIQASCEVWSCIMNLHSGLNLIEPVNCEDRPKADDLMQTLAMIYAGTIRTI